MIVASPGPDGAATDHAVRTVFEHVHGSDVPTTTVLVSLYNYQQFIRTCLDSVAAQTVADLDLIVIDDCSQDESVAEAHGWLAENCDRFHRCLLLANERNRGPSPTRNAAFAFVRTECIFILDADNQIYPRCIAQLEGALSQCDASFAFCYRELFGRIGLIDNRSPWNPEKLPCGNYIDAMVLMRSDVWRTIGGNACDMPHPGWEDFDLWFKIARRGGWAIHVPEILARYRVHGDSLLHTTTNRERNHQELWDWLRDKYAADRSEVWPRRFDGAAQGPLASRGIGARWAPYRTIALLDKPAAAPNEARSPGVGPSFSLAVTLLLRAAPPFR